MSRIFPQLPRRFYDESPTLRHVRDAANARRVAPDAVLVAVLARVAASTPSSVTIDLPMPTGLNFIGAIIGEAGDGKSKANRSACDLLPDIGTPLDDLPVGSGEGLIDVYMENVTVAGDGGGSRKEKRQVHDSAYFYYDEGELLLKLGKKDNGSIILQTLRSAWSGSTIGTTNANPDLRRILRAGSYRFALTVGFQPVYAAELLNDHCGGTPQRFLFASAVDGNMPTVAPPWPGLLTIERVTMATRIHVDPLVVRLMDDNIVARHHRRRIPNVLETHRDLITVRVAALLSIMDNCPGVSLDYWNRAVLIADNSCRLVEDLNERAQILRRESLDSKIADRAYTENSLEENRRDRDLRRMVGVLGNAIDKRGEMSRGQLLNLLGRDRHKIPDDDLIVATLTAGRLIEVKPNRFGPPGR